MNPRLWSFLLHKGGKNIQWEDVSSTYGSGRTEQGHTQKKQDHFLTSCTNISPKWIEDLHVRPETIELLQGAQAVISLTSALAAFFLNTTSEAR